MRRTRARVVERYLAWEHYLMKHDVVWGSSTHGPPVPDDGGRDRLQLRRATTR